MHAGSEEVPKRAPVGRRTNSRTEEPARRSNMLPFPRPVLSTEMAWYRVRCEEDRGRALGGMASAECLFRAARGSSGASVTILVRCSRAAMGLRRGASVLTKPPNGRGAERGHDALGF